MATAQINQKMHDIAEARWKMLPIAVQREHEILGKTSKRYYDIIYMFIFQRWIFPSFNGM